MKYKASYLGGRCSTGNGLKTHVIHIVASSTSSAKSICGATYGRRSGGWFDAHEPVTCPACTKKAEKLGVVVETGPADQGKQQIVILGQVEKPVPASHELTYEQIQSIIFMGATV